MENQKTGISKRIEVLAIEVGMAAGGTGSDLLLEPRKLPGKPAPELAVEIGLV